MTFHTQYNESYFDDEDVEEAAAVRPLESFLAGRPKSISFLPAIVLATVIVAVSILGWQDPELAQSLAGNLKQVSESGEWYRCFSCMFLHKDARHLISNLVFLVPLGGLLSAYYGLAIFPLMALLFGGLTYYLSLLTYAPHVYLIGASGLVYVLFGMWISLMFYVESHLPWTKRFLRIIGFGLIMFIPSTITAHVSYQTHFIGLGIGLISGTMYGYHSRYKFMEKNLLHLEQIEREKLQS